MTDVVTRVESSEGTTDLVLFHGTSAAKVDAIRTQGLNPPPGVSPAGWFMLTTSFEQAARYATAEDAVVLEYRIPAALTSYRAEGGLLWPGQPHDVYGFAATAYAVKGSIPGQYLVAVHPKPTKTAGPAGDTVPLGRFPVEAPHAADFGPNDVVVFKPAQKDIDRLPADSAKKVRAAIEALRNGTARGMIEAKEREPLLGTYTLKVTNSLRVGFYLSGEKDDWHVYWVGEHNYVEAERRFWNSPGYVRFAHPSHQRFRRAAAAGLDVDVREGEQDPMLRHLGPMRTVYAYPKGKTHGDIGRLSWFEGNDDAEDGEIADVYVADSYRRKGVATKMLEFARTLNPEVFHSDSLTDDGYEWSKKTAGLNGDLPEGLTFECNRRRSDGTMSAQSDLVAYLFGEKVGHLWWSNIDGKIGFVGVEDDYRRKGIARALLDEARRIDPTVHHSDNLTDEGRAWAEHTAAFGPNQLAGTGVTDWWLVGPDTEELAERQGDSITYVDLGGKHFRLHSDPVLDRQCVASVRKPDGTYKVIGYLMWYSGGEISGVLVDPPYRRLGLASAMLAFARKQHPSTDIHHSRARTDDGQAWSEKVAGAEFEESEHPRADDGKFTRKGPVLGRDEQKALLREEFGPSPTETTRMKHPRSGWMVELGLKRSVARPPEGQTEGPPVFKVTNLGKDFDDPIYKRYMSGVDAGTEPIEYVYRGMSKAEYEQAMERGHFASDKRGVIADWEGTNAAVDPETAAYYLSTNSDSADGGYIVKFKVHPDRKWFTIPHDQYLRTREQIPLEDVVKAVPFGVEKDYGLYPVTGARHTAGANGSLPAGLKIEYKPAEIDQFGYSGHELRALVDGQRAGSMTLDAMGDFIAKRDGTTFTGPREVTGVSVYPEWRRRGIATALWEEAKRLGLNPEHSPLQYPDGKAWARTVASADGTTYYHGSPHRLEPGTVLRAGVAPGNWSNTGKPAAQVVWLTDDPQDARQWATDAARQNELRDTGTYDFAVAPEVFVYEVQPLEAVQEQTPPSHLIERGVRHFTVPQAKVLGLGSFTRTAGAEEDAIAAWRSNNLVKHDGEPGHPATDHFGGSVRPKPLFVDGREIEVRLVESGPVYSMVTARLDGIEIGTLSWENGGAIDDVQVAKRYQRRGVASHLLAYARWRDPDIRHSTNLTDEGRAWSQRVGSADGFMHLWHTTTPEYAQRLTQQGTAGVKPVGKNTTGTDYEPGRGMGKGLYLSRRPDPTFGTVAVPVRVREDELMVPPERAHRIKAGMTPIRSLNAGDGYTEVHLGPDRFGAPRPVSYDNLGSFAVGSRHTAAITVDGAPVGLAEVDATGITSTRVVVAFQGVSDGEGGWVGFPLGVLTWDRDRHTIEILYVAPDARRKGLANRLWQFAKGIEPRLHHSTDRTPEGDAWARATGDDLPERDRHSTSPGQVSGNAGRLMFMLSRFGPEDVIGQMKQASLQRTAATVRVEPPSSLDYGPSGYRVTERIALHEGSGYHPDADVDKANAKREEAYQRWRAEPENKGRKRPERYREDRSWVPAGFVYFTEENATPGTVAFIDLEVSGDAVRIAYAAVRPDHRGKGLARKLIEEVYARHPKATIHWGKIMQPQMGHLYEQFKASHPEQTGGMQRYYSSLATEAAYTRPDGLMILEKPDGLIAIKPGTEPMGQITWTLEQDERAFDDDLWEQAIGDHNGYYLKVDALVVSPQFRRQGVGTALLEEFVKMAERHYGPKGWDPGEFTADGAAFWKAVRHETVPVTRRITGLGQRIATETWERYTFTTRDKVDVPLYRGVYVPLTPEQVAEAFDTSKSPSLRSMPLIEAIEDKYRGLGRHWSLEAKWGRHFAQWSSNLVPHGTTGVCVVLRINPPSPDAIEHDQKTLFEHGVGGGEDEVTIKRGARVSLNGLEWWNPLKMSQSDFFYANPGQGLQKTAFAGRVDYKPERPLTGSGAVPLASYLPHAAFHDFEDAPWMAALDAAMDTHHDDGDYLAKRKAYFAAMPTSTVRLDAELVITQRNVNVARVNEIAEHPERGGSEPIWMVRHDGQYWVLNGHHRLAADWARGEDGIAAKVWDAYRLSPVAAGAHGDLPEGLTFHYTRGMLLGTPNRLEALVRGEVVGFLEWKENLQGPIVAVEVEETFRRRGVATALLTRAREIAAEGSAYAPPAHTKDLTPDGKAWSEHTGGRNGDLPAGVVFKDVAATTVDGYATHIVRAWLGGSAIGYLMWNVDDYPNYEYGEILDIRVDERYQRRGVASAMLKRAREIDPEVRHSSVVTDDGAEWAIAVGSKTASASDLLGDLSGLSEESVAEIKRQIAMIPSADLAVLRSYGVEVVAVDKASSTDYARAQDYGAVYDFRVKQVQLSRHRSGVNELRGSGAYLTVLHELGHAMDYAKGRPSQWPVFARIQRDAKPTMNYFKGKGRGAEEIFAESWAAVHGGYTPSGFTLTESLREIGEGAHGIPTTASLHTAAPIAAVPDGLTFKRITGEHGGEADGLAAYLPGVGRIGEIHWQTIDRPAGPEEPEWMGIKAGEVGWVHVLPQYRRRGIARMLWDAAKQIAPHLHHSSVQTSDGKEWGAAVAHRRTANMAYYTNEWRQQDRLGKSHELNLDRTGPQLRAFTKRVLKAAGCEVEFVLDLTRGVGWSDAEVVDGKAIFHIDGLTPGIKSQRNFWTVLHECAHVIAEVRDGMDHWDVNHGPGFKQVFQSLLDQYGAPMAKIAKTGALTLRVMHNPVKAPKTTGYGQDIEPAGKYLTEATEGSRPPAGWQVFEVTFANPLRIEWGEGYDSPTSWKRVLHERYGKTGAALSAALRADGYDGIITFDKYGTSEIVDLRGISATGAASLDAVIAAFADAYGHLCEDPEEARDRCVPISEAFAAKVRAAGHTAEVVSGMQMGEHPLFPGLRMALNGHFAVVVDGTTSYDWTARQFDPSAPVPLVEPAAEWAKRWPRMGARTAAADTLMLTDGTNALEYAAAEGEPLILAGVEGEPDALLAELRAAHPEAVIVPGTAAVAESPWWARAQHTAGMRGDTPKDLSFVISDGMYRGQYSGKRFVIAHTDGRQVGSLGWFTRDERYWKAGEIFHVAVEEAYQRRGIASAMLAAAKRDDPRVHHSSVLTDEGRAWSQKAAGRNGDLPAGLEMRFIDNPSLPGWTICRAVVDDVVVGELLVTDRGTISWVNVFEDHMQRRGIATEMLKAVRKVRPVEHGELNAHSRPWAAHVGSQGSLEVRYTGAMERKRYTLVTQKGSLSGGEPEVRLTHFDSHEDAEDAGKLLAPDVDGLTMPNVSPHLIEEFEAKGSEYSRGLFWHGNRYAAIIDHQPGEPMVYREG